MPERARRPGEVLYGRNAVIEALRGRRTPRRLVLAEGVERQPRLRALMDLARERQLRVDRLRNDELDRLIPGVNHQGVALEATPYPYASLDAVLRQADGRPLLALDHVQDPQNLGTLMRTAEAAGIGGLLIPERRSAGITPAVVNASAGAVEHLSVALVGNLGRVLDECREAGYWTVALDAEPPAVDLFQADIPDPTLLIVGSEGSGIAPNILKRADVRVRLPMLGSIESLNASVAGSIALYEILRRRQER